MKIKTGALLTAVLAFACALLIFPAQATAGAKNGVNYCLNILIPSLYPFMVLSVFVVKSGLAQKMGNFFEGFTKKVFNLPGCAAASVLISTVGGYPAGARGIAALYENGEISSGQAEQMLCFCVNAGPSFVITAVGVGLLKSARAGALLFVSQLIVFVILGIVCGAAAKNESKPQKKKSAAAVGISQAFVISAADAAYSTLNMCCFVILFAALMNLIRVFIKVPVMSAVFSCALEVTGGCFDLARLRAPLWAVAFAIGWGGICVHFQVLASVSGIKFSRARFVFFRLLQGILSAAVSRVLTAVIPGAVETLSSISGPVTGGISGSVPAAAALIALCAALLFSMPREKLEIEHD